MDKQGVIKAIALLGTLWTNYKPPEASDVDPMVETWLRLFGTVNTDTVHKTILKMSAEGRQFPPQVGEIYKAIKDQHDQKLLSAPTENAATKLRDYRKPIDAEYKAKGLYPYHEAREHGVSSEEWERMVKHGAD
jgi:hypothetical protein